MKVATPPVIRVLMNQYNEHFDYYLSHLKTLSKGEKMNLQRKMRDIDNEISYQVFQLEQEL